MAKKDEGSGYAPNERPAQSAEQSGSGSRGGERSSHRAPRMATETANEAGRLAEDATQRAAQAAEESGRQAASLGRQTTERTAQVASDQLRQSAELMRKQGEEVKNLFTMPTQAYRELAEYSRADFDAMLQSGARLARDLQEMGWEMTHFTQESLRLGMQLANELLECRTVEDMVSKQRDFMKETVDAMLAGSTRLLSMSNRLANDAVSPISKRVGAGEGEAEEPPGQASRGRAAPERPRP